MKVLSKIFIAGLLFTTACDIMPHNTLKDCNAPCKDNKKPKACYDFCDCIHKQGKSLKECKDVYDKAPAEAI